MTASHESARKTVHTNKITFNSDKSFFTVSMNEGLRVYLTNPLELYQSFGQRVCKGKVCTAEQLDGSSIVTIVSSGAVADQNQAKLIDLESSTYGAIFTVAKTILNALLRDDKLVLVQQREVQVYLVNVFPLKDSKEGPMYSSGNNPLGLCQLSWENSTHQYMCFPGHVQGTVQIISMSNKGGNAPSPHNILRAHQGPLQCMSLSQDGSLLATASTTGTLIRLWDTTSHHKLREFRRGLDPAIIYDIDISADNLFMGCVSDKGTVHVFALTQQQLNMTSNLSALGPRASYTDSVWGMTQFSVHGLVDCKIAVLVDCSVVVVTKDGRYYKYQFTPDGNKPVCRRTAYELYSDLELQLSVDDSDDTDGRGGSFFLKAMIDDNEITP